MHQMTKYILFSYKESKETTLCSPAEMKERLCTTFANRKYNNGNMDFYDNEAENKHVLLFLAVQD